MDITHQWCIISSHVDSINCLIYLLCGPRYFQDLFGRELLKKNEYLDKYKKYFEDNNCPTTIVTVSCVITTEEQT